ncbi:MAG: class I SAM-dependent methyltransferase [Elusimicrobiota bacterium]
MHIGVVADSWIESLALKSNRVADPLLKTQFAYTMARAVMAAVELGVFETLVEAGRSADDVARVCACQPGPMRSLLNALVACEYLVLDAGADRYSLTAGARKWLLRSSPDSCCDKLLMQNMEWDFLTGLARHVKDGTIVDLHESKNPEVWRSYQRGMADLGKLALSEILLRAPIPKNARSMLDIGGSGGTYSAAFVKRRPGLSSLILDLPGAVEHAKELVKAHGLPKDRLSIRAGNALDDDLGADRYDFVLMGNVAHHLTETQNRALAAKVARALKDDGVFCILEPARTEKPSKQNQFGALLDLYFGLTSRSGTWTAAEMPSWLAGAGLKPGKPIRLLTAPGAVLAHGRKSGAA